MFSNNDADIGLNTYNAEYHLDLVVVKLKHLLFVFKKGVSF